MSGYRGMSFQTQSMLRDAIDFAKKRRLDQDELERQRIEVAKDAAAAGPNAQIQLEGMRIEADKDKAQTASVENFQTQRQDANWLNDVAKGRSRAEDAIPYLSEAGRSSLSAMMNLGGVGGGGQQSGGVSQKDLMGNPKAGLDFALKEKAMMDRLAAENGGAGEVDASGKPVAGSGFNTFDKANEYTDYLNKSMGGLAGAAAPIQTTDDFQQRAREHHLEQQFAYRTGNGNPGQQPEVQQVKPIAPLPDQFKKIQSVPMPAPVPNVAAPVAPAIPQRPIPGTSFNTNPVTPVDAQSFKRFGKGVSGLYNHWAKPGFQSGVQTGKDIATFAPRKYLDWAAKSQKKSREKLYSYTRPDNR